MELPPTDFESAASASSAIPAFDSRLVNRRLVAVVLGLYSICKL